MASVAGGPSAGHAGRGSDMRVSHFMVAWQQLGGSTTVRG